MESSSIKGPDFKGLLTGPETSEIGYEMTSRLMEDRSNPVFIDSGAINDTRHFEDIRDLKPELLSASVFLIANGFHPLFRVDKSRILHGWVFGASW